MPECLLPRWLTTEFGDIFHAEFLPISRAAVEFTLDNKGGIADVITVRTLPDRLRFLLLCNREQASPANGIERTISILPVRKNNWKCENHRKRPLSGENLQRTRALSRKMFN